MTKNENAKLVELDLLLVTRFLKEIDETCNSDTPIKTIRAVWRSQLTEVSDIIEEVLYGLG